MGRGMWKLLLLALTIATMVAWGMKLGGAAVAVCGDDGRCLVAMTQFLNTLAYGALVLVLMALVGTLSSRDGK